ncbi:Hypothetical protein FKW44_000231 [Caligus rogercresseyi]|uniref:Uncharacterized protein n=1 Tax=Caligus rogercresseyi TaxID=217165 RepID=A0A7T8KH18_CALRO|nr:Hypothetical protein FKW44_000231 [Caligus rogercresseyi]
MSPIGKKTTTTTLHPCCNATGLKVDLKCGQSYAWSKELALHHLLNSNSMIGHHNGDKAHT